MTLIYDRPVAQTRKAHAFVLGVGRFPNLNNKDVKSCYDSAKDVVDFLVRAADRFTAPLATIECLMSDPDITPTTASGADGDQLPICHPQFDPRTNTQIASGTLNNVRIAATDWINRCKDGDLIFFYGCSHGVAERDKSGMLVLEDINSNPNNNWEQLLDVYGIASFLPAKKLRSDVWVFMDACQELIPDLVQMVGGVTAYVPVTANVKETTNTAVRASFTLAGSRVGGFAEAPTDGGVAYFTKALLHSLDKCCVERDSNGWFVTGKELMFGVGKVSLAEFGHRITPSSLRQYNEDSALLRVDDPEFPVLVSTNPSSLMKSAAKVGLHAPGSNGTPLISRDNLDPQWRCKVRPTQAPLELRMEFPPSGTKTEQLIMKPPAIIMEVKR